jgi:hypothetical protein
LPIEWIADDELTEMGNDHGRPFHAGPGRGFDDVRSSQRSRE